MINGFKSYKRIWSGPAIPCLFQSCCDEMDIVLSMHLVSYPLALNQVSQNLHMLVVLFDRIWRTKPLTGCQIKSLLFIFTCWLFIFPPAPSWHKLFFFWLYLTLSFSLPPSFLHWLASRLSAAEFKHCSLQQHMKQCYLEPSRNVALQSSHAKVISSSPAVFLSLLVVPLPIAGVSSSACRQCLILSRSSPCKCSVEWCGCNLSLLSQPIL